MRMLRRILKSYFAELVFRRQYCVFIQNLGSMYTVAYLPQSKRLLEQVSEVLRYKHYSLKTEQAYLYWVRFCALARQ